MTFSCRAELEDDLIRFLALAQERMKPIHIVRLEGMGDDICRSPQLEFLSRLPLTELRALMYQADPDTHVMRQSLRPCALAVNSLERDLEVE